MQTVDKTAQTPGPFAVGTIVLQFGIEAVEFVLSPLMMTAHLSVVVHLLLTEVHNGDGTVGKQLSRQGQHARTNHQGIRCLTNLRIGDDR